MKKIIYFSLLFCSLAILINCEKNDYSPRILEIDYVGFEADPGVAVPLPLNGSISRTYSIYSSQTMNSDRSFNIIIDESSSADGQTYNIPSSVTIPAGSNEGSFEILFEDINIGVTGETLTFNITSSDDSIFIGEPITLTIVRDCPSDLAGTYLVSSTAVGCCGVAPITNYQYTVTVTAQGGGIYSLSDYSGGMYDGLFCAAFGICGNASTGNITDICNNLSGSSPDCCGDTITFSGTVNLDGTWTVSISSGFLAGTSTWTKQ